MFLRIEGARSAEQFDIIDIIDIIEVKIPFYLNIICIITVIGREDPPKLCCLWIFSAHFI